MKTDKQAQSLREAAQYAKTNRAHNPAIFYDTKTGLFSFGPDFPELRDENDAVFVNEYDIELFISNWFGNNAPSRFRICDARHCIDQCERELENLSDENID